MRSVNLLKRVGQIAYVHVDRSSVDCCCSCRGSIDLRALPIIPMKCAWKSYESHKTKSHATVHMTIKRPALLLGTPIPGFPTAIAFRKVRAMSPACREAMSSKVDEYGDDYKEDTNTSALSQVRRSWPSTTRACSSATVCHAGSVVAVRNLNQVGVFSRR